MPFGLQHPRKLLRPKLAKEPIGARNSADAVKSHLSRKACRLCENPDATLTNRVFAEFSPILSDQKPANRKNSL
jgi:hypothetical protein